MADLFDTYSDSESEPKPKQNGDAPAHPVTAAVEGSTDGSHNLGAENSAATKVLTNDVFGPDHEPDAIEEKQKPTDAASDVPLDPVSKTKQLKEIVVQRRETRKNQIAKKERDGREDFTKLKITNRSIEAEDWNKMMNNKKYVPMTRVSEMATEKKTNSSSVIIGVLFDKVATKTAASGNKYATWMLTDMNSQPFRLSVQLYDQAFEAWSQDLEKGKLAKRGSIFAILNPKVYPQRSDKGSVNLSASRATCSVNTSMQLAKLGDYPLLSMCTAKTKGDDRPCGNPIEKNPANFGLCLFHRQEKISKHGKGERSISNPMLKSALPRLDLRLSEKKEAEEKKKKEEERLSNTKRLMTGPMELERRRLASQKDRNRIILEANMAGKSVGETSVSKIPMLGRGLSPEKDIMLEVGGSSGSQSGPKFPNPAYMSRRNVSSSSRNIKLPVPCEPLPKDVINTVPGLPVLDPNNPMANKRKLQEAFGEVRIEKPAKRIDLQEEDREEERKKKEPTLSLTSLKEEFERRYGKEAASKLVLLPDEMEKVRNAQSKGCAWVVLQRLEERDRILHELEFRDEFDLQKATVQFLEVKAYYCSKCKMTTDNVAAKIACEGEGHVVTTKNMKKTRWECTKCYQSAFALEREMPNGCAHCGNETFKQVGFYKVRSAAMEKDLLEKRGVDHERYLKHETKMRVNQDKDAYAALDVTY